MSTSRQARQRASPPVDGPNSCFPVREAFSVLGSGRELDEELAVGHGDVAIGVLEVADGVLGEQEGVGVLAEARVDVEALAGAARQPAR